MAIGKKKEKKNAKKNRDAAVKQQLVQMKKNPLYPEKQESTLKDILTALGTLALCLVLVGIITVKFSYATGNAPYDDNTEIVNDSVSAEGEVTEVPEDDANDTNDVSVMDPSEYEAEEYEASVTDGDYILYYSDSRYITENDLHGLSKEELSYARNEIYARHGRRFKDEALQQYFDSKDWYEGTIAPEDFSESMLNDYEIENAGVILEYEKEKGYR